MTTDIPRLGPCAVCGHPATETHHIQPRGRRPDLRDLKEHPENAAPTCHECNTRWLIPGGPWEVHQVNGMWQTLDVQSGELICRRPVKPGNTAVLSYLARAADKIDYRDSDRRVLLLVEQLADDELDSLDEIGMRYQQRGAGVRMVARYEAAMRHPFRGGAAWVGDLAKRFKCSEAAVYEDVRATELYANDEGPPLDASWYRQACHAADPQAALKLAHETHEAGGSITDFRKALGLPSANRDKCTCVACGNVHNRKE